jgi:2-iminobutanoate/2-iminopropanoate deaminase
MLARRVTPDKNRHVSDIQQVATKPDPYAAYRISQAIRVGDFVFVSGQAAIDESGALVGIGNFDAQAEQTFRNLERVLVTAGSGLDRVVKVTIYLTDMSNFPKIVDLRGRWFRAPYPADTIVEVRSLALPELEIEIEAIAVAGLVSTQP